MAHRFVLRQLSELAFGFGHDVIVYLDVGCYNMAIVLRERGVGK
jgi:hypothetical protein